MSIAQAIMASNYATGGGTVGLGVFIGSNSYITFGGGSSAYNGLSSAVPGFPKIMMSSADNSYQRVYVGSSGTTPNRTYLIRYEGNSGTSGTIGNPGMVWEATFYEATPNQIDIQVGVNNRYAGGLTGVYTTSQQISGTEVFDPAPNTGWRITTDGSSGTVNSIASNILGSAGLALVQNNSVDDGYMQVYLSFPILFNGTTYQ